MSATTDRTGDAMARAPTGVLIRRLAGGYLKPYRARLAAAIACMVVAGGGQPGLAWLMEPLVTEIFIARDRSMLMPVALAVVGVMVGGGLANFGQAVLMNWVGLRIVADLRQGFLDPLYETVSLFGSILHPIPCLLSQCN